MNFYWPSLIGFFLGFAFGVGCALAVMYSIYMGGYRAAVRDSQLPAQIRVAAEIAGASLSSWIRERLRAASLRELDTVGELAPFLASPPRGKEHG